MLSIVVITPPQKNSSDQIKTAVISRVRYDLVFDDGTVRKSVASSELLKTGLEASKLCAGEVGELLRLRSSSTESRKSRSNNMSL
jgi:hypothetical protein